MATNATTPIAAATANAPNFRFRAVLTVASAGVRARQAQVASAS
jgi:hypothetical protein